MKLIVLFVIILACICQGADAQEFQGVENPWQYMDIPDVPWKIDPRERLEFRSDNSFTLDNGDGTYTGFFYGEPIFNVPKEEKPSLIAWLFSFVVPDATATNLTNTYYSTTDDGYVYGDGSLGKSYSTARSTSKTYDTGESALIIGQNFDALSQYYVFRSYVEFTTSNLSGYTVVACTLALKSKEDYSTTDFDVQISEYAWSGNLASNREADYDGALASSSAITWRNTSGMSINTYYKKVVTAGYVNTSGDTRYSLRSKEDKDNSAPTNEEYMTMYSANQSGTTSDPYLIVVYTETNPPTPSPATFDSLYAVSTSEIRAVATAGTDISTPVEYYFYSGVTGADACNDGTGYTSQSWTTTSSFNDTGLNTNHRYRWYVQMKDALGNSGTLSSANYLYTLIEAVAALTIGTTNSDSIYVKTGTSLTNIACESSGVRYACSPKADTSAWLQNTDDYVFSGLEADSQYTFTGQSRNGDAVVTTYGGSTNKRTYAAKPGTPVLSDVTETTIDCNPDKGTNQTYTDMAIKLTYGATTKWVDTDGSLVADTVWQTDAEWGKITVTGLTGGTEYTFGVVAKNGDNIPTALSATAAETTLSAITATKVKHMDNFYLRFMDTGSDSTTVQFMKD